MENVRNDDRVNLEITDKKDINKADENASNEIIDNNSQNNMPILLEEKKKKKANKRKKIDKTLDIADEETENNPIFLFSDGDEKRLLGEGEHVVGQWSF